MMKSFQWGSNYSTGVLFVDEQHKGLVDLINTVAFQLSQNSVVLSDIDATFATLMSYTESHFADEEKMVKKAGLDPRHLKPHLEAHQYFLEELILLYAEVAPDNQVSIESLLDFLIHWLGYHILVTDKNMARQVELIKSGSTAKQAFEQEELEASEATEPLITALNGLFHQASVRNEELAKLNNTLEKQVAERTKSLLEANGQLNKLALTDALTGLPNRRHAMQQFTLAWNESITDNSSLACMMIDADYFKEVNDTHGHDAGDNVLCELSTALLHTVRTDDIVCRLGGDEYIVICPNTDSKGVMHLARLVQQAVAILEVQFGGINIWTGSISIGVAVKESGMINHHDLIKAADNGVYSAKKDGRNCVR